MSKEHHIVIVPARLVVVINDPNFNMGEKMAARRAIEHIKKQIKKMVRVNVDLDEGNIDISPAAYR